MISRYQFDASANCRCVMRFCAALILALAAARNAQCDESAESQEEVTPTVREQIDNEQKARAAAQAQVEEMGRHLQNVERAYQEAQQAQRAEAEQARAIAEESRMMSAQKAAQLQQMQQQLEVARNQLSQLAQVAAQKRSNADPLPPDAELQAFTLKYVKAENIAAALEKILRNSAPRIAVDERTNVLLIAGNEDQISVVEKLTQTLDRPTVEAAAHDAGETLQVRIVWLLDIDEGVQPTDKLISPQVIEALGELGFEHPKVVCQQVTTLTLGENRQGQFHFQVPVLIQSQQWQLEGQGQIEPMAGTRFNLKFDLRFHLNLPQPSGGGPIQQGQLGGSIFTPLGHYTVMGTTTFVAATPAPLPDGRQPGEYGTGGVVQQQHLSAFVVYLDRAQEFPASGAHSEEQSDRRR
jgi:Bacterial type II/III secretion system short domain